MAAAPAMAVRPVEAVRAPMRVEPAGSPQALATAVGASADRAVGREIGLVGAWKGRIVDVRA